jgi:cystathionine beta-lyase/cystathionine gamma-synthase
MSRVDRHLTSRTRLLYLETPTNPTLRCVDIKALSRIAHRAKVSVVVDNTFATPILQKPLALGADAVMHSGTKYLGGHSDLTAGALVGSGAFIQEARHVKILTGGVLDPGASYLLLRGMKTLEVRVERACRNAMTIARALARHPKVARVMYPGLESHQAHALARRQMRDFGMMIAIELAGSNAKKRAASAERFMDGLKLWYLATSLGGVESTVSYPVLASHVGMSPQRLRLMDVSAATVRLSVGIEDAGDLVADLEQALARA